MKRGKNLLEQLKTLPYFNKETILQLSGQYGIAPTTINTLISRALKRKDIIPLKRGLYVSTDFYEKNKGDVSYRFYLANVLRKPSYISSWTALQYYDLTTDVVRAITSVAPKITRSYDTKIGSFAYSSIKEELFSDFVLKPSTFGFFIASPAKALFDMLYFRTRQFRGLSLKQIESMISELRIDFDEMEKSEREKFYSMIKPYVHHG